jgi:tetratricopeptide (TPR) repeat protein
VSHRTVDTETFLAAMERMSGVDLSDFAERFIYGTGVPEVYYDYEFERRPEGGWVVEGNTRLVAQAHHTCRLVKDESGNWGMARDLRHAADLSGHFLVVPFQIALREEEAEDDATSRRRRTEPARTAKGLGGTLRMQGERTRFEIPLDREPRRFWLDQRGEVLAEFHSMNARPKRALRWQAMELSGQEAEATLQRALAARYISEGALEDSDLSRKQLERYTRLEDARIYCQLAQLYLDQGRVEAARQAFEEAKQRVAPLDRSRFEVRRLLIESRLDVREGEFKAVYSRLSGYLRLKLPRHPDDTVFDSARRKKFRSGRVLSADAYALLALSAHKTGHDFVARVAMEEAEERGADVSMLREEMEAAAAD